MYLIISYIYNNYFDFNLDSNHATYTTTIIIYKIVSGAKYNYSTDIVKMFSTKTCAFSSSFLSHSRLSLEALLES